MLRSYFCTLYLWLMIFLLSSCSSSLSGNSDAGYQESKSMVLDILQSEDGKKAILAASQEDDKNVQYHLKLSQAQQSASNKEDSSSDQKSRMLSREDFSYLQQAVQHVLSSNQTAFLKNLITDKRFANDFAKAIHQDTSELQKQLLKDPEYQKLLLDVMKNPDYEKLLLETMKSIAYRQLVMNSIEESLQSPLFRANLVDLMKIAIEQQSEPEKGGETQKSGSSDSGNQKSSQKKGSSSEGTSSSSNQS